VIKRLALENPTPVLSRLPIVEDMAVGDFKQYPFNVSRGVRLPLVSSVISYILH